MAIGCGTFQAYEGLKRPVSEVALVRNAFMGGATIESIDGKPERIGNVSLQYNKALLLPGEHTFEVRYDSGDGHNVYHGTSTCTMKFTAVAGQTYVMKSGDNGYTWWLHLVDKQKNTVASCGF